MLTAILVLTALVIAVVVMELCKVSGECAKIEESAEWGKKWNQQREKEKDLWCDGECFYCSENQFCKLSEV